MKKHKHDSLIREWLDNGRPQVEVFYRGRWHITNNYFLFDEYDYRLVYPPKPQKQIKMLCWLTPCGLDRRLDRRLDWRTEDFTPNPDWKWKRVPAEDKFIEVEE